MLSTLLQAKGSVGMSDDAARALVRLAEAVRAYICINDHVAVDIGSDSDMIVDAEIARELRQALKAAEVITKTRRIRIVQLSVSPNDG